MKMNKWQFTIEDLDKSLLEELKEEDARSYLLSKYDIETANKIISLLLEDGQRKTETIPERVLYKK